MKLFRILIFGLLILSCEKNDDYLDFLHGPWDKYYSENIELCVRPQGYTERKSPDSVDIELILSNQNNFLDTINRKLNISSDSKFKIYLFNLDEAEDKIGTNTGGSANGDRGEFYYTFFEEPLYHPDLGIYSFLSLHELVHLVTYDVFKCHKTILMTEGYACAIDNTYGGHYGDNGEIIKTLNSEYMEDFVKYNMLLTPNELLLGLKGNNENQYYPQVGTFINWLFDRFGIDKINQLYCVEKQDFKNRFKEILNTDFDDIEQEYLEFCENEFK